MYELESELYPYHIGSEDLLEIDPQFPISTSSHSLKSVRDALQRRTGFGAKFFHKFWPEPKKETANSKGPPVLEPSVYGIPLEEVDPLLFDGTFCVVSKKYSKNYVYRFSMSNSLLCFGPLNPLRKLSIYLVTHQWFDILIILTILANCVTLAMAANIFEADEKGIYTKKKKDEDDAMLNTVEYVFLAIYTLEMVLKIICKGFLFNKYSYLRSKWNMLDFLVVSAGYFSILSEYYYAANPGLKGGGSEFEVLRTLRVLRAVKTISILPGLRMMINALLSSAVQLLEVMGLTLFCLMIFALFAQEVFMGKLRQKCVTDIDLTNATTKEWQVGRWWLRHVDNPSNWLTRDFPKEEYVLCSNDTGSRLCPTGYVCLPERGENPDDGWSSFDNFFASMLTTFQLITLDYWERIFDLVLSTSGPLCIPLFVMVVFLGSYYLINLMLAVVTMSYETAANDNNMGGLSKNQKLSLVRSHSTFSFEDVSKLSIQRLTHYYLKIRGDPREKGEKIKRSPKKGSKIPEISESDELEEPESPLQIMAKEEQELFDLHLISHEDLFETCDRKGIAHHCKQIEVILRARLESFVDHAIFEGVIMACIIANTLFLACERHGQPNYEKDFMEKGNVVFMVVFTVEALLKIVALQRVYFQSGWNVFDVVTVLVSIVDLNFSNSSFNLSVIRGMRLLRVFKLAKSWITMKILLNIIFSTFEALSNLTLVLLIVLYIFSVMGMQVIGGNYLPHAFGAEENYPRWNFTNFWYSFMMVFRVLCGEWIEPLWDCLLAHKTAARGQEWRCFMIFLPILIIGNFIVLNLFLALLLNSFNAEELKAQEEKEEAGKQEFKQMVGMLLKTEDSDKTPNHSRAQHPNHKKLPAPAIPTICVTPDAQYARIKNPNSPAIKRFRKLVTKVILNNRKDVALAAIERQEESKIKSKSLNVTIDPKMRRRSSIIYGLDGENAPPIPDPETKLTQPGDCIPAACWEANCCRGIRAWGCWPVWAKFRQLSVLIVGNPAFEWIILTFIFASSITLAFEDKHLDDNPRLKIILLYLNFVFTGIFLVEMLLKWVAIGLWSYFTNMWTILDAFIVVVSLISIEYDLEELEATRHAIESGESLRAPVFGSNIGALKALRTFRAFRPLRAISRWQGMKMVVNALMYAIPAIFNVLLVCLLFWLIFSIMGVQFFKGKFYKCIDKAGGMVPATIVPTREVCCSDNNTEEYSWINTTPNFDNVFEGYLSLFQIATFEGWMELMRSAVDATQVDFQPIRDSGFVYYSFFVVFIVFGSFFTLNLFIGIIIDNFNMLKKKYEGNLLEAFLTPSQRHYYAAMKKLGAAKPTKVINRPNNCCTALFYDIAMSRNFEISIFFMIFMNMVIMGIEHYQQSEIFINILAGFNSFFTTIYAMEALVKIMGLRHHYFTIPWNIFDFVLVLASLFDLFLGDLIFYEFPIPPTMLRIARVFRIGRVLRLVKAAKGVRKLLFAFVVSIPALFNIGALLGLITFIYAILGMALFKDVPKYNSIDSVFNFETFLNSFIMLFRLMTAAGWNDVLDALTNETPVCGNYRKITCGLPGEPECPSRAFAVAFLVTYILITHLIVINMYIAIILENFGEANRQEQVGIVEEDLEAFYIRWSRYDPQATQFINFEQLFNFLAGLDPPLTLPKPNTLAVVSFNLPIAKGNKIHCLDVLHALVKHVLGQVDDDDNEEFKKMEEQMEQKFAKQFPTRNNLDIISSTRRWKREQNAATIIQRHWRSYQRGDFDEPEAAVKPAGNKMLNRMGNFLNKRTDAKPPGKLEQPAAKRWNTVRTKMLSPPKEPVGGDLASIATASGALIAIKELQSVAKGTIGEVGGGPDGQKGFDEAANTFSRQLFSIRKTKRETRKTPRKPEEKEGTSQDISVEVHHTDKTS